MQEHMRPLNAAELHFTYLLNSKENRTQIAEPRGGGDGADSQAYRTQERALFKLLENLLAFSPFLACPESKCLGL